MGPWTPALLAAFSSSPIQLESHRLRVISRDTSFVRRNVVRLRKRPLFSCATVSLNSTNLQTGNSDDGRPVAIADVSAILLAGGVGSRMKADRPKQFLELDGKSILEHSLELLMSMPEIHSVILVLDEPFRSKFSQYIDIASSISSKCAHCAVRFANPGIERQDSVRNGLSQVDMSRTALVCVHDAARPLVTAESVRAVLSDARSFGAAVLGVPSKATIKESADGSFVLRTIDRSRLWEIQTPQVMRPDLLTRGFRKVEQENLAVTDDVSIVEHLGEPVKITMGEYTNIKITTPEDLDIARSILRQRKQ